MATSTVDLDAEELRLRASETNVGNLVADAIRESVGRMSALVNAGAFAATASTPPAR